MEQTKLAYEKKYQAQLDEMKAQFDQLSAKAKKVDAEAKLQLSSNLEKIKARQQVLEARLEKFRETSDDAWKDFRKGLDDAVEDVNNAFSNARSHFSS